MFINEQVFFLKNKFLFVFNILRNGHNKAISCSIYKLCFAIFLLCAIQIWCVFKLSEKTGLFISR